MFASMYKSLFKKSVKYPNKNKNKSSSEIVDEFVQITTQDVENMLTELDEIKGNSNNESNCSTSNDVLESIDLLSLTDTHPECPNDNDLIDHSDDTKSEVSSIGENKQEVAKITEDSSVIKTVIQINDLQCPFTWNIKPNKNKNITLSIQNKYGEYNLNISSPEFTFERYIGNLVISYELFHKNETEQAQMKILEIGKWLEELDNGSDEFYLSISTGLKHVMKATFIHMLFATNLFGECKWLLDDIESFASIESQSKATIYAVHAAVLTEYGGNVKYFQEACEYAKIACEIDPVTSHWFYIYSIALTAQRHYLYTYKSCPTENEINAIQQAIMLSDGKNTSFNYHRMTLDRGTAIRNYHQNTNKNDKVMIEKNLQANKILVQMIKTIVSMDPKDPHLVIKCAKTVMTLPVNVRDFNLGKKFLTKAFQMAPNDSTVLKAIENTVESYKEMTKRNKHRTTETKQNQPPFMNNASKLSGDLRLIMKKHKNGEDAVPYLIVLCNKYSGHDKLKMMAQICSYTILYKNNLRAGVELFISLIEQPKMDTNYLITQHYSSFGSKKLFNLAELICNEIRLATNSSNISSEDMLFYYKMLTKIMETCDVKVKEVDSSMKDKLIVDSFVKSTKTTYQSESDSFGDRESLVEKNKSSEHRSRSYRQKHMQNTGPKVFPNKPELNRGTNKMHFNSNKNSSTRTGSTIYSTNETSIIDQMKFKMAKFTNTSSNNSTRFSNNSNPSSLGNLRNLQTQSEIEHYTQQLYQHIVNDVPQQQNNSQNVTSGGLNAYYNRNNSNISPPFQLYHSQNPHIPSLLSSTTLKPPNKNYKKK